MLQYYFIILYFQRNIYRRAVFDKGVDRALSEICQEIQKRYGIKFLEIGTDKEHVHFLAQSVPKYSVTKLVTMIKSLTAREVFRRCLYMKKLLWGGEFWSDGYVASTVGKHGDKNMIGNYAKDQEKDYERIHEAEQLTLF